MEGQYGNTIISRHGGGFCGRLCFDLHHKRKIELLLRHLLKMQLRSPPFPSHKLQ